MNENSNVVIVGAGPCGSFTAYNLAKHGQHVSVYEEHGRIGLPAHCAGHLSIKGLRQLGLHNLPAEIIENTFYGANFYSPAGNRFTVRLQKPVTCVVNRAKFDSYLAEKAENAGAHYCLNSRVETLEKANGFTSRALIRQNKTYITKDTKLIVDAEGISSRLTRQAGLHAPSKLLKTVEAEVENVRNTELDTVDVYLGHKYAPDFYAWLIPKETGKAKIGLATRTGNPKDLLQNLILKNPSASRKLRSARIVEATFHTITLGGLIPQMFSNGFLAVGDAASQVKPTTGGGVIFGMNCAKIASQVAAEAIERNDFSKEFLSSYQRKCTELVGFDMRIMLEIRRILDRLPDRKLDEAVSLCTEFGLDKAFSRVDDIDFQGQSLLRILSNPRIFAALMGFFFVCVFTNP